MHWPHAEVCICTGNGNVNHVCALRCGYRCSVAATVAVVPPAAAAAATNNNNHWDEYLLDRFSFFGLAMFGMQSCDTHVAFLSSTPYSSNHHSIRCDTMGTPGIIIIDDVHFYYSLKRWNLSIHSLSNIIKLKMVFWSDFCRKLYNMRSWLIGVGNIGGCFRSQWSNRMIRSIWRMTKSGKDNKELYISRAKQ